MEWNAHKWTEALWNNVAYMIKYIANYPVL